MKAIKHIRAGLLNIEVIGNIPEPKPKKGRAARSRPTCAAQLFYNNKCSWQELELLIANNFGKGDLVVTLTYDDEHLPKNKTAAKACARKFLRKLREVRKRREEELLYVYTTEGFHGAEQNELFGWDSALEDKRLHHHLVLNGNEVEELRSLWEYGEIRAEAVDIHYYRELAKYLTKEAREEGRAKPGERTWCCSRNLDRDCEVEYIEIPMDGVTLTAPEGAINYEQFHEKNPYGFADCIGARYLLYPKDMPKPPSYAVGRKSKSA